MSGSLATLPTGADRHGGTAASTKIHELGATPLDEADEGEFELVTSTVSQVEVAFGKDEQDSSSPDPTVLSAIEAFWVEGAPVRLIEFHRLIGLDARDLVRIARLERGERLTPLDAIHLASAQRLGAAELHTYDGKLLGFKGSVPFDIREPWAAKPRFPGMA